MKRIIPLAALLMIFTIPWACLALDHPGGFMTTSQTWYAANNPHRVLAPIYVHSPSAPLLTIEPGCVVQFAAGASLLIGDISLDEPGDLSAVGTMGNPIVFTSAGAAQPGAWGEIRFQNSIGPASAMRWCELSYGGNGGNGGMVYCHVQVPPVENCIFEQSSTTGIRIWDAAATPLDTRISNCTFLDNLSFPIQLKGLYVSLIGTGNTYSGNTPDQIQVLGDYIDRNVTWENQGIPYRIDSFLVVHGVGGATLTLRPGIHMLFEQNGYLRVGDTSLS
ncbi:right-handed parallel beta-helix repeat-containing protein, partial [bacterium]|nr:right-handed parallel beta-helix repeat-containing protein [candidate division CSSED10-310 bacterium]